MLDDPSAVAAAGAEILGARAAETQPDDPFRLVLSGGSTPRALYEMLAREPEQPAVPWRSTDVLFGDERCVPPDSEQSNFRMAREALLRHVPVADDRVHRIRGEDNPDVAAEDYEYRLRALFAGQDVPRFDLLLLGIGTDGHTASLFPETAALDERERWVAANHVGQLDAWRITLTYPALCSARHVLFMITGASKAQVVAEAFGDLPHDTPHPSERVVPVDGTLEILLDRAAASRL